MIDNQVKEFLEKYAAGSHGAGEHLQFTEWLKTAPMAAVEEAAVYYEQLGGNKTLSLADEEALIAKIEAALNQYGLAKTFPEKQNTQIFSLHSFRRIAAVAAVLILVASGAWLYFNNRKAQPVSTPQLAVVNDIAAPTSAKAMITLADGRAVVLDSVLNGTVAMQHEVRVVKNEDGEIVYKPMADDGGEPMAVEYNTLYNPRGSKVINLTLSDGSKVWLNAESSLRYPVAFNGNERKVEITGEAYFEASPSPFKGGVKKPFIVKKGGVEVTVLGTHFNVNTYEDEKEVKVTLLEGSVRVSRQLAVGSLPAGKAGWQWAVIKPGQQAVTKGNAQWAINSNVDIDAVMAWKNGFFAYKASDLATIMRQVSKWYDVDVVFEKPVTEKFYVELPRNIPVSNLFKILEATKAVHFKIEGKTIYVTP
jgi:transmembrane sensor